MKVGHACAELRSSDVFLDVVHPYSANQAQARQHPRAMAASRAAALSHVRYRARRSPRQTTVPRKATRETGVVRWRRLVSTVEDGLGGRARAGKGVVAPA